jgi:hypothetical protein
MKWLDPPYWIVEAQVHTLRRSRGSQTLRWAHAMPEFPAWAASDVGSGSQERIFWIHGLAGCGKSIMPAYFIDLLKVSAPNSILAYFFCKSNVPGLRTARDIIRALTYQCSTQSSHARVNLETSHSFGFQVDNQIEVGYLVEQLIKRPLQATHKEVIFILDGLDETDGWIPEPYTGQTEVEALVHCLSKPGE